MSYVVGDTVTITSNTFLVGTTPTDPATLVLVVTDGDGTSTSYAVGSLTHVGPGIYSKSVTVNVEGIWSYLFTGTTVDNPLSGGTFDVTGNLYCTKAELKSRLGITNTTDDAHIVSAIDATCSWIDDMHCEDFFGQVTQTRTFVPSCGYELCIPSLVSVTTLKTDNNADGTFEISWTEGTDYDLLPYNRTRGRETRPYNQIKAIGTRLFPYAVSYGMRTNLVQIVGVWGWPAIPAGVKEAALIIAEDTFKLKDAPFGVAGFDTFGAVRVRENSPALKFLAPYRRNPVTVG